MSEAAFQRQVAVGFILVGMVTSVSAEGAMDEPILTVRLAAEKEQYLLGEAVDLHVIVRNTGDKIVVSVPVFVKDVTPQIPVFISQDGKTYEQYRIGLYVTVRTIPGFMDILAPGEERAYPLRVLYTYQRPSRLALKEPSTYFLKALYRVQISEPFSQVAELESNTRRIEVKKPSGVNAMVWEDVLNTKQFIQFLHSGQVAPGFPEVLDKAVDIGRRFPTMTYAGTLRAALREYYRLQEGRWDKSPRTRQELRELLEIDDSLFPDDDRLDIEITYNFPEPTRLRDFLAELSSACDVPLSLAPEGRDRRFRAYSETHSLRDFMKSQASYRFVWVRRDDGYELTTEDKAYAFRLREAEAQRAAAKQEQ